MLLPTARDIDGLSDIALAIYQICNLVYSTDFIHIQYIKYKTLNVAVLYNH